MMMTSHGNVKHIMDMCTSYMTSISCSVCITYRNLKNVECDNLFPKSVFSNIHRVKQNDTCNTQTWKQDKSYKIILMD